MAWTWKKTKCSACKRVLYCIKLGKKWVCVKCSHSDHSSQDTQVPQEQANG